MLYIMTRKWHFTGVLFEPELRYFVSYSNDNHSTLLGTNSYHFGIHIQDLVNKNPRLCFVLLTINHISTIAIG